MFVHKTHVPISHFRAWRACKAFPTTATIKMLVNVPRWRPGGLGADFWDRALGPATKLGTVEITVADAIAAGKAIGLNAGEVQLHLKWLWTWQDQVEIGGKRYIATTEVPLPKAKAKEAKAKEQASA